MRKLTILLFFIMPILLSGLQNQAKFEFNSSDNDDSIMRVENYAKFKYKSLNISNVTLLKYNSNNEFNGSYYNNYLKNTVAVSGYSKQLSFSAYVGAEGYFDNNKEIHISGIPEAMKQENQLYGGFSLNYNFRETVSMDVNLDMRRLALENDDHIESDQLLDAKLQFVKNDIFKPFFRIQSFNDLNDNSDYNYHMNELGTDLFFSINHQHFFKSTISTVYDVSDGYEDNRMHGYFSMRHLFKYSQDWLSINRFQARMIKEDDELLWGTSFIETIVQRNLSYTDDNDLALVQLGTKYYTVDEQGFLKLKVEYPIKLVTLHTEYRHFYGADVETENEFRGGLRVKYFNNAAYLNYSFIMENFDKLDDTQTHSVSIQYIW